MPDILSREEFLERMERTGRPVASSSGLGQRIVLHTDATDFFAVNAGDVLLLDDRTLLIRNNAREGRFGLDDEVKYWVKRATDLADGSQKIVKIPFFEKFDARVGGVTYECFRSPAKESRILDLVRPHPNFMHGDSHTDEQGNNIRVIEFIFGATLPSLIEDLPGDHERYFRQDFPNVLDNFIECVGAISFLHDHQEKHGDIRRDHIIIDRDSGRYRWIDFDYNYRHRESMFGYDLFGLGNVLAHIVGKGDVTIQDLKRDRPEVFDSLWGEDLNIIFRNRVMNLGKVYPYIPDSLNRTLLHFSAGALYHYETTAQLLDDLHQSRADLGRQ